MAKWKIKHDSITHIYCIYQAKAYIKDLESSYAAKNTCMRYLAYL